MATGAFISFQGATGSGGDNYYEHVQSSSATTWIVGHGLGKYPSVTITNSNGDEVKASIRHITKNLLYIYINSATTGVATCN